MPPLPGNSGSAPPGESPVVGRDLLVVEAQEDSRILRVNTAEEGALELGTIPGPFNNVRFLAVSPDGAHAAVVETVEGQDQLSLLEISTGNKLTLSALGTLPTPGQPSFSRDGTQLVFLRERPDGDLDFVVSNLTGDQRVIAVWTAAGVPCMQPSWSRDGASVIFAGRRQDDPTQQAIFSINALSVGAVSELYAGPGVVCRPVVSNAGDQLAFTTLNDTSTGFVLVRVGIDGQAPTPLADFSSGGEYQWTLDDSELIYAAHDAVAQRGMLYAVSLADQSVRGIAELERTPMGGGVLGGHPRISRDGATIVYTTAPTTTEPASLFTVPVAGGQPSLLRRLAGNLISRGFWL